ncbi:hypothetical protein GNI_016080 [Gregarina niphandrodes]|uniref:Uncharacterized protein n=1 Tax=Gregarina niphandrodes TaxID=110365 RepID=A0A023BC79_GRENI|nr:hypothetical protein GNI_016080 [Gregarina niphandrodes]EZG82701.1 hypothetical protein GNI_016080 [Gregarina niphandrodes]|eukprot:XP_011128979.1 hypothetical protein GNI_016080 [Gregarina niphandrodes]
MDSDRLRHCIDYRSEPYVSKVLLASHFNIRHPDKVVKVLEAVAGTVQMGLVNEGENGEVAARLILLLCVDATKRWSGKDLITRLVGRKLASEANACVLNSLVNLNHFVRIGTDLTPTILAELFVRGAGGIGTRNQQVWDFVIPIWMGGEDEQFDVTKFGALIFQVKNRTTTWYMSERELGYLKRVPFHYEFFVMQKISRKWVRKQHYFSGPIGATLLDDDGVAKAVENLLTCCLRIESFRAGGRLADRLAAYYERVDRVASRVRCPLTARTVPEITPAGSARRAKRRRESSTDRMGKLPKTCMRQ